MTKEIDVIVMNSHGVGQFCNIKRLPYLGETLRAWNWRQDNTGVGPGLALALDPKGGADGDNYLFDLSYLIPDLAPDTTLELRAAYMDINIKTEQTLFPAGAVLPRSPGRAPRSAAPRGRRPEPRRPRARARPSTARWLRAGRWPHG